MSHTATVTRKTRETNITVTLDLHCSGKADLHTGIGFFDHMLDGFARHGLFDLTLLCDGDLNVDCHQTIDDCGIALGTAIREALGDKAGIVRYGSCMLPMDETLALCAVDLGGRPYFVYDASFAGQSCGGMDVQMAREFFYAVSYSAMMNLHLKVLCGDTAHHKQEAKNQQKQNTGVSRIDRLNLPDIPGGRLLGSGILSNSRPPRQLLLQRPSCGE